MVFREIPLPAGAAKDRVPICNGHCACSGYGSRANCPPLIILATTLLEDPVAAALFPIHLCPLRSQQA